MVAKGGLGENGGRELVSPYLFDSGLIIPICCFSWLNLQGTYTPKTLFFSGFSVVKLVLLNQSLSCLNFDRKKFSTDNTIMVVFM